MKQNYLSFFVVEINLIWNGHIQPEISFGDVVKDIWA